MNTILSFVPNHSEIYANRTPQKESVRFYYLNTVLKNFFSSLLSLFHKKNAKSAGLRTVNVTIDRFHARFDAQSSTRSRDKARVLKQFFGAQKPGKYLRAIY